MDVDGGYILLQTWADLDSIT